MTSATQTSGSRWDADWVEVRNEVATRAFIQAAWNEARYGEALEHLAPDFVNHTPSNPTESREEFLDRIQAFRSAFPDLIMTVEHMLAAGEYVVTRWSARGTHLKSFRGLAATGKRVDINGIAIDRLADGRRVEGWAQLDMAGLLNQMSGANATTNR